MQCHKCGWQNKDDATSCVNCFAPLGASPVGANQQQLNQQPQAQQPPQLYGGPAPQPQAPTSFYPAQDMVYVGFGGRVLAYLLDAVVMGVVTFAVYAIFGISIMQMSTMPPAEAAALAPKMQTANVINWIICLSYMVGMITACGATLGKMALGYKIVKTDGSTVGVGTAIVRTILETILGGICGLTYLAVAFSKTKQAWHDSLAGTVVIRTR